MAQIVKRKSGYLIRVSCGYSADGKTQITQSKTWKPPRENMTEKQLKKALDKAVFEFEAACLNGKVVNTRKLESVIEDWFAVHETALAVATIQKNRECCERIFAKLGHIRIDKIKTADIDRFLTWLAHERRGAALAECKFDLKAKLKETNESQAAFARRAGVSTNCIRSCILMNACIRWENAVKIAKAFEADPAALFTKVIDESTLSAKTIRNYHGFLSTVFSYAVKIGEISANPCTNCTLPKLKEPERVILSLEQAQKLLQLLDEHSELKYRAFFNLAIYGGFRRGELLALTWNDIDFENSVVHIRRAVHWNKARGYYYTEPKTRKSKRAVKMTDRVMYILKQLKNEQLSAKFTFGEHWNNASGLVFTSDSGSQMSMGTPYKYLNKFCSEYGLPKVSVHSLRHLNATLLINSGANPKTVQSLLGHSTAVTTMTIYAHEIQSAEAAASSAVAALIDSQFSGIQTAAK